MIEVLVALIIFAFGLLGAAGLQLSTLRSNQFASSTSIAMALGREYAELMQAFPASIATTAVTSTFFLDTSNYATVTSAFHCTGSGTACTTNELRQAAIADWVARVQRALPGGRAQVCRDSEPRDAAGQLEWDISSCDNVGDLVVIKFGWTARNDKGETLFSEDRPRAFLPVLGNLRDYVTLPPP
jgi:type IV pilus assembly protein PilV